MNGVTPPSDESDGSSSAKPEGFRFLRGVDFQSMPNSSAASQVLFSPFLEE